MPAPGEHAAARARLGATGVALALGLTAACGTGGHAAATRYSDLWPVQQACSTYPDTSIQVADHGNTLLFTSPVVWADASGQATSGGFKGLMCVLNRLRGVRAADAADMLALHRNGERDVRAHHLDWKVSKPVYDWQVGHAVSQVTLLVTMRR